METQALFSPSFPIPVFFFLLVSYLKYSITVRKGSGQTQEAELIGSTRISMGMCDQSLLPRAFPSLHLLLLPLLLLISVCLIVPARGSPQFPLTSWPLLPVRCVNAAFNQFYCLAHTQHTHRYSWPYPSLLSRARFIKISPHPITHPHISYSQTTREHGHVALSFTFLLRLSAGLHTWTQYGMCATPYYYIRVHRFA